MIHREQKLAAAKRKLKKFQETRNASSTPHNLTPEGGSPVITPESSSVALEGIPGTSSSPNIHIQMGGSLSSLDDQNDTFRTSLEASASFRSESMLSNRAHSPSSPQSLRITTATKLPTLRRQSPTKTSPTRVSPTNRHVRRLSASMTNDQGDEALSIDDLRSHSSFLKANVNALIAENDALMQEKRSLADNLATMEAARDKDKADLHEARQSSEHATEKSNAQLKIIDELTLKVSKLENQLSDLSSSLHDKEEHIRHLTVNENDDQKFQSLQAEFQEVSEQKLQVEKTLLAKESALVDFEKRFEEMSQELQAKIQSLQTEFQDVSEQKLQMEKALSAKESALVDLETKVAEISLNSHAQIQSLQAELNDVSEQKLQVQKALSAKESALGDPETRVAEISEDLNAKIESLEADLNDMSQQKLQVEKELLVKESALGVLESRVEEVSQELLGWKEKADTFSREKCCAEEDATKLRTKIGDLEDGLAVMTRERDTVKGRLEELEILYNASLTQAGAKATMEEELVASRAEVSALKSLLAEAESRYEDLFDVGEKHTVDLESRLNDAESEGKRLEEALAAASGRNRQLEEEISTTSNHVQELSNHVDSLQAQIDKMREVGAALLTAKTQLEEENDDLLDQMAVLKEAGLAADAVRTELEAQLKSCEGAVEEAKETANGLHQQLQRQQEVVREAEEEHKRQIAQISANIATTFSDKVTVVELERDDIQRRFEELETLYNTSLSRAGEQAQLEEALEASRVEVNTLKSLLAESEARYEGLFDAGEKHTIDLESRLNATESERQHLDEALATALGRNRQLEEDFATTSNHVQELSNHVDSLQAQIDKMREAGAVLLTAKTQLEEENDDLLDQMAVLKEAGVAADAVRGEMETQLRSCEKAVEEAKETANGLHRQLKSQQESIQATEEEHNRQIAQIRADIETTFSDKVAVVESERDEIKRRFEELDILYNASLTRASAQAHIEEELEASRIEVITLNSRLSEAESRYEELFDAGEKHTIDLESRLNAAESERQLLDDALAAASRRNQQLEEEIANISSHVQSAEHARRDAESNLEEVYRQVDDKDQQLAQQSANLAETTATLRQMERELDDLRNSAMNDEYDRKNMIDQYEDLVERKSELEREKEEAFAKLAHALSDITSLETAADKDRADLHEVRKSLGKATEKSNAQLKMIDELTLKVSKLENQLSDVSSSLRDKEEHIRHLTLNANDDDARIRNLQADLEDVLNQNQQMEKVLSSRETALNDIETRVTEMSQELSYLRNQADTLSREKKYVEEDATELRAKIRDLQDAQEAMTRDLCNQVEQTDTLSREKTYAEEDAHQLRMKIRDLQDRLSILTRENKELELRLSAAHVDDVKIQNLQADLEDMSEQKQQVEKVLSSRESALNDIEMRVTEMSQELSHLKDHAHTLAREKKYVEEDATQLRAKIRDLQDAIEAMTREKQKQEKVVVSPLSPSKPSSLQREIDLLKKEIELKKEEIESIHQDYKQVLSVAEEKVRTYAKLSDSSLQSMELYRDELAKKKEKLEEVQKEHQKLQLQIARSMPITNTPDASMADISSMADALHRAGKTSKTIDELVQSASNKKETTPNFCCGHVVCHKRCTIKDPPSEPEPQPSNAQPVGGDYSLTSSEYVELVTKAALVDNYTQQVNTAHTLLDEHLREIQVLKDAIEALSSQMAEKAHSAETSSASRMLQRQVEELKKVWSHELAANMILRNLIAKTQAENLAAEKSSRQQQILLREEYDELAGILEDTHREAATLREEVIAKDVARERLLIEISRLKASFQDKISSSSDTVDDLTRRLQDSERTRESLRRQCSALKEDLRRSQNDLEQARHTLSSLPNDRLERAVSSKIQQLESRINSRESELQQKDSLIRNLEVRLQELFQSNGDILEEGRQRENVLKKEAQARMSEVKELSERLAVLDEGKRVIESHYAHEREKCRRLSLKLEDLKRRLAQDDAVNTALRPATRSTSYEDRLREEIQQLRRELSRARHSTSEIVAVVRETLNQTIGHGDGTSLSSPNRPPRFDISRLREQMGSLISEVIYLRALVNRLLLWRADLKYQKFYLSLKVEDLLTSQKSTLTFIQEIGINLPSTEPTFTPSATTKLKKCANAIIAVYRMMVLARNWQDVLEENGKEHFAELESNSDYWGTDGEVSARKTWSGERRM